MSDEATIKTFIRDVVRDKAELEEELADDQSFGGLEIDSLVVLEVVVEVEKRFGVRIQEERYPDFSSVNKAYTLVRELLPS